MSSNNFRKEAVAANRSQAYGSIVFIRPLSFTVMTWFAIAVIATLIALLIFGGYTKKSVVRGELVPKDGVITITSPQKGIVTGLYFASDSDVQKGIAIFDIENNLIGESTTGMNSVIETKINNRVTSIGNEIDLIKNKMANTASIISDKQANLKIEKRHLEEQEIVQKDRLTLSKRFDDKYTLLFKKGLITEEQHLQKRIDFLNQKEQASILSKSKAAVDQELLNLQQQLQELSATSEIDISQLSRELAESKHELIEERTKGNFSITSPINGVITSILVHKGQAVEEGQILAIIIPKNSKLYARLLVPSKAIGFIKSGNTVSIRYEAFPYQHYGQQIGTIESISNASIMTKDAKININVKVSETDIDEPVYIVDVGLNDLKNRLAEMESPLKAGMLLEADIQFRKLPLYMWIFEPLFSIEKL